MDIPKNPNEPLRIPRERDSIQMELVTGMNWTEYKEEHNINSDYCLACLIERCLYCWLFMKLSGDMQS